MTLPFAVITWIDASMNNPHWQVGDLPDIPSKTSNVMKSSGFIAHKTPEWVVIVQTVGEGVHANSIEIPVGMIKEIKIIQEAHTK